MDDQLLPDVLSPLAPSVRSGKSGAGKGTLTPKRSLQADTLKVLASLSGGVLEPEISEFLNGSGVLHENTRSALTRGKKTASSEVAALLTEQFKLAPATAGVIAALLVRLFPSISKLTGTAAPEKKKPRRKTKPKAEASSTTKKRKKKTAAKEKPAPKKKAAPKKTKK